MGIAVLFKAPFGLLGGAMIVCAIRAQTLPGTVFRRLAALALGFAAPITFCLLWFYANGALGDLVRVQFVYAPEYVKAAYARLTLPCAVARMTDPVLRPIHAMALIT